MADHAGPSLPDHFSLSQYTSSLECPIRKLAQTLSQLLAAGVAFPLRSIPQRLLARRRPGYLPAVVQLDAVSWVAPLRVIMIIASLGILTGVLFSCGIMEIARKGIFRPQLFTMPELARW